MRRGELLNTTWWNIDFDKQTIDVTPRKNTDQTWDWHIKDTERCAICIRARNSGQGHTQAYGSLH